MTRPSGAHVGICTPRSGVRRFRPNSSSWRWWAAICSACTANGNSSWNCSATSLRWFVGLNLDQDAWDASTFSQNRRRRFDESGVLEQLFDATIKQAMTAGLVSRHVSADGTLVRANASYKSFLPIEVALDPEEYKRRLRRPDLTDAP